MSSEEQTRQKWARKVGQVFNTMPRIGSYEKTVWLPRGNIEKRVTEVLENRGVHICMDGPTGTEDFTRLDDASQIEN